MKKRLYLLMIISVGFFSTTSGASLDTPHVWYALATKSAVNTSLLQAGNSSLFLRCTYESKGNVRRAAIIRRVSVRHKTKVVKRA